MTARLAQIVRHPIKSLGFEEIAETTLSPGQWMPGDRVWALAHSRTGAAPGWKPKIHFLRGVTAPGLMAIRASTGPGGGISLTHPDLAPITVDPGTDDVGLARWIAPLWPETQPAPTELVRAEGCHLSDVPDPWVSILNLSSLDALGGMAGAPLSIHRWRGNLWLDGLGPWEEKGWAGKRLRIGEVVLDIMQEITRCKATAANPDTGTRDVDTLAALAALGHQEFGVYARVVKGGTLRAGDTVTFP